MNTRKLKIYGYAAVALLATGAGSYYAAAERYRPEIVQVSSTGCGVPATLAGFGVPMRTIAAEASTIPVRFGPFAVPDAGGVVHLTFDPAVDGNGREVRMTDGDIVLPVTFGRDGRYPERIVATCRDGAIATIRYVEGRRNGKSFTVVPAAETASASPQAADSTAPAGPLAN